MTDLINYNFVFNELFSIHYKISDINISLILEYLGCNYEALHFSENLMFNYKNILISKCNIYNVYYEGDSCPYCEFIEKYKHLIWFNKKRNYSIHDHIRYVNNMLKMLNTIAIEGDIDNDEEITNTEQINIYTSVLSLLEYHKKLSTHMLLNININGNDSLLRYCNITNTYYNTIDCPCTSLYMAQECIHCKKKYPWRINDTTYMCSECLDTQSICQYCFHTMSKDSKVFHKWCTTCKDCHNNMIHCKACFKDHKKSNHCKECNTCKDCEDTTFHCNDCEMCHKPNDTMNNCPHCDKCINYHNSKYNYCNECQRCHNTNLIYCDKCDKCNYANHSIFKTCEYYGIEIEHPVNYDFNYCHTCDSFHNEKCKYTYCGHCEELYDINEYHEYCDKCVKCVSVKHTYNRFTGNCEF